MEGTILYVGIDSTQYSNGIYTDGRTKELCVAIFSTDPECLKARSCVKKRDFSILEEFLEDKNSASITIDPESTEEGRRPVIHSAARLTSFYMENALKQKVEEIQLHIDGPLYGRDKNYLKKHLARFGIIRIEDYRKFLKKNRDVKRKNGRTTYGTQPRIVIAADALSNLLFRKRGTHLFPNLDSREARTITISVNGESIEHFHLST